MRVFCPQHKTGFLTPRRNPIRCENRGHVLGEFIFHSDANATVQTLWEYCCNCEQFAPIELVQGALEACPACARRISQLYMCDHCFTLSFESSPPGQTKNFSLTTDGAPQPSCPGCFEECSGDLREHECDPLGARFVTGLKACPICLEHLDVGPAFPSSAAQYLRKIRAANKLNVAFDYATGLFLPGDNGEFVLVNGSTRTSRPFVLPRATRFKSKRDFYELYQDYFHCPDVNSGELHIIEPAFVERVANGWKLQSMGTLEIVNAQPEPDAPARIIPSNVSASKPVEGTRSFAPRIFAIEDESTVQQHVDDNQPLMFSWAEPQTPKPSPALSLVKLIAMVVVAFGLVTLGVVLLKGPASQLGDAAEVRVASSLPANVDKAPQPQATNVAADETNAQTHPATNSAEQELLKLRDKLAGASPSDQSSLQLFASVEEQFPDDYRFPYERAKLLINPRETRSHHAAFNALSLAAEKAIEADKADEMLKALEADSVGDFHKLTRGHHEWTHIMEALKRKQVALLTGER